MFDYNQIIRQLFQLAYALMVQSLRMIEEGQISVCRESVSWKRLHKPLSDRLDNWYWSGKSVWLISQVEKKIDEGNVIVSTVSMMTLYSHDYSIIDIMNSEFDVEYCFVLFWLNNQKWGWRSFMRNIVYFVAAVECEKD